MGSTDVPQYYTGLPGNISNYMVALAQERTKSLRSMIRNKTANPGALGGSDSGKFFNDNVNKRWDETLGRARPAITQLLGQLRTAEREWNKQAAPGGHPEEYELASLEPVIIPFDPVPEGPKAPSTPVSRVIRRANTTGNTNLNPVQ